MNATTSHAALPTVGRALSLRGVIVRALGFLLIFVSLQAGWEWARGSLIEKFWIQHVTVRSATNFINLVTPDTRAVAQASRIVAPGVDLTVHFGGEGTDAFFMLAAAFLVVRLPARSRLIGLATGLLWVFMLNQLRISALFYALRADRNFYDLLHATAAPYLMIALAGGFLHLWLRSAEFIERQRSIPAPLSHAA